MLLKTDAPNMVQTIFNRDGGKQVCITVHHLEVHGNSTFIIDASTRQKPKRNWTPLVDHNDYTWRQQKDRDAYELSLMLEHVSQHEIDTAINAWLDARKRAAQPKGDAE